MLTALSPLDGRYSSKLDPLRPFFSAFALQKYRVAIELRYLAALAAEPKIREVKKLSKTEEKLIEKIIAEFSEADGREIKKIEKTTNHDVKAVEYFLQKKLAKTSLASRIPFIHFALTSEDVNNLAYALMTRDALKFEILPQLKKVHAAIFSRAKRWKNIAMLSRTHGQTATPTTLGKEFYVFAERLKRKIYDLEKNQIIFGKLSGATGNFAAHAIAYEKVNWPRFTEKFVHKLGLVANLATTQIESHDWVAEVCDIFRGVDNILIDFSRDVWQYISLGFFKLKKKEGEVGSSTMPHKINPIDFENAEGNFGIANAIFSHLSNKLPISRLQRDLSDSTVFRNLGCCFGHAFLGWQSLLVGIEKLEIEKKSIARDLENNPEVLAEAIQTVLRKNGDASAYEKLKTLTRGSKLTLLTLHEFVKTLELPATEKEKLLNLTPAKYIGFSAELVR